jgi:hypothetical protein
LVLAALAAGAWWAKPQVMAWRHRTVCAERNDAEACTLACVDGELGEHGCLAAAKRDGKWSDDARELLTVACRGGELKGCIEATRMIGESQRDPRAQVPLFPDALRFDPLHAELSQRGCELGDLQSCTLAANDWLDHDPAQWRRAVTLRCRWLPDSARANACARRFEEFLARDLKQGAACKQGDAQACRERGLALLDIHPGAAVAAFAQECAARGIARGYQEEPCAEGCRWYDGNRPSTPLEHCGLASAERWHTRQARVLPPPLAASARPELKVVLSEVKLRRGNFTDAEPVLGAEPVLAALRGCYAEAVTRPGSVAAQGGKVAVRVVVDALGDAERTLAGNSDLLDRALIECSVARLEDVHFSTLGDADRLVEASYTMSLAAPRL